MLFFVGVGHSAVARCPSNLWSDPPLRAGLTGPCHSLRALCGTSHPVTPKLYVPAPLPSSPAPQLPSPCRVTIGLFPVSSAVSAAFALALCSLGATFREVRGLGLSRPRLLLSRVTSPPVRVVANRKTSLLSVADRCHLFEGHPRGLSVPPPGLWLSKGPHSELLRPGT